jgi:hypothetical protein
MADNTTVNYSDPYTVSTDEAASGQVQRFKLAYAADGSDTHVPADADGLLVNVSNAALPVTGTFYQATQPVSIADPVTVAGDVDIAGLPTGLLDSFGHIVTASINNQVDVQFYRDTPANLVTVTTASGGTATAAGGMATFAATTAANSSAKGVSLTTTYYTAGAEIYAIFTAAFPAAGSGTSHQRIGLYNDNDGLFIGYEGGTFQATIRKGGADVGKAKAQWDDPLTGGAGSQFTRDGVPEAIDLAKFNVWRIRFGWVGSAPLKFEVLSPDGGWVTFYTIQQPNLVAVPSLETADLPVTLSVTSGNSGTALSILTNCWAAGTTQALARMDGTITDRTLAQLSRSVITGETTAGGGGYVNVKVDPSGSISAAVTGTVAVSALPNEGQQTMANSISVAIASNQTAVPVSVATVPSHDVTNAGTFAVQVTSAPTTTVQATDLDIRNLSSATDSIAVTDGGGALTVDGTVGISGSVAVTGTFWQTTQPVSGTVTVTDGSGSLTVDGTVAATQSGTWTVQPGNTANTTPWLVETTPNQRDLATAATAHVKKYYTNSGAVTDGIVWSPAAGKRWFVTDIFINVSAAATVTLEDDLTGGDSPVWKAELAANSGWSHSFTTPLFSGEDAADLLITTTAGNCYVTITGYEI